MKKLILILVSLFFHPLWAQKPNKNDNAYPFGNPVIKHMYTADASPHVMPDGKVWMVTSVDSEKGGGYSTMHAYHTFSSSDMVNWTDHGEVLHVSDLWGEEGEPEGEDWALWAPDLVYYQGRYLLYFPVRILLKNAEKGKRRVRSYIALAESSSPDQTFTIIEPKIEGTKGIDPCIFIDDDGERYLYYGNHWGAKLKDNMKELEGDPLHMEVNDKHFMEAIWMNKFKGKYYLSYHRHYGKPIDKDNPDDPDREKSRLDYGISDSPLGPFAYAGILNRELGVNVDEGPKLPGKTYVPWRLFQSNHGGIVEYHGQEYLFYHTSALSSWRQDEFKGPGTWTQRSVCIDKIEYEQDGTIRPVQQTLTGIEPVVHAQPFAISPTGIFDETGKKLSGRSLKVNVSQDAIFSLGKINLGTGYYYFGLESKGFVGEGKIEIRLDRPDGLLVGTLLLDSESPFINSKRGETFLRNAKGKREVFLVVKTNASKRWTLKSPRFFAGSPQG